MAWGTASRITPMGNAYEGQRMNSIRGIAGAQLGRGVGPTQFGGTPDNLQVPPAASSMSAPMPQAAPASFVTPQAPAGAPPAPPLNPVQQQAVSGIAGAMAMPKPTMGAVPAAGQSMYGGNYLAGSTGGGFQFTGNSPEEQNYNQLLHKYGPEVAGNYLETVGGQGLREKLYSQAGPDVARGLINQYGAASGGQGYGMGNVSGNTFSMGPLANRQTYQLAQAGADPYAGLGLPKQLLAMARGPAQ